MMVTGRFVLLCRSAGVLQEDLFVYPHETAGLVGLDLILDAVEAVAKLAVFSLVVVVVFHLPHCLKHASIFELPTTGRWKVSEMLWFSSLHTLCVDVFMLTYL